MMLKVIMTRFFNLMTSTLIPEVEGNPLITAESQRLWPEGKRTIREALKEFTAQSAALSNSASSEHPSE
jgi:hypothetical protein